MRPRILVVLRFQFLHRVGNLGRHAPGHHDLNAVVMVALLLDTLSAQPERLTALCSRRDLRPHRTMDRRNFDFRATDRLADRDRKIDVDVIVAPLEERMRPDVHQYIEIARGSTRPRRSLPAYSDGLTVGNALRDLHFDVADADRQVHRRTEDLISEVDRQLRVYVAADHRHLLKAGDPSAEQIREDVGETTGACASAATSSTRATRRASAELPEVESGEGILA